MSVLRIKNPDLTKSERTWLTSQYTTGTTLNVQSSKGWADDDIAVLGNPGEEKTESTDLTAAPPSDLTLTVTAADFTHNKDCAVYRSKWDQIELSKKPSGGAYAVLATFNIQWDKLETLYDDTAGLTTDTYKFRFKKSTTSTYSSYSDELLATGYSRKAVSTMIDNVKSKIRDTDGKLFTDQQIIDELNTQQDRIEAMLPRAWFLQDNDTSQTTVASTNLYNLPTDLKFVDVILFNYVNGNTDLTYPLHQITEIEMDDYAKDNTAEDQDELRFWCLRAPSGAATKGQFQVYPTPETATLQFTIRYYREMTSLDSAGDITDLPDPELLENMVACEFERRQGNVDRATMWQQEVDRGYALLKHAQRRSIGEPKSFLKFKGQRGVRRIFGERGVPGINVDTLHEDYF